MVQSVIQVFNITIKEYIEPVKIFFVFIFILIKIEKFESLHEF